jgi:MoaA/NifB/PqqE/SkfB family radical SAM enzyme
MKAPALGRTWRMITRGLRLSVARTGGRRMPFSMTFILTHRCNFRCAHCDIPDAAGDELSTSEVRAAIDELAACGMARASFSGGEALLRDDAPELIAHARTRGAFTSLNSNGWLVPQRIDALAPVLDMLVLSLDGPSAIHDAIRGCAGSQRRVLEAIEAARARGIRVATITVVSRRNAHAIEEVLALAARHGFWAYFQPSYRTCFDHRAGLDASIDPGLLREVAARLRRARAEGLPVGSSAAFLNRLSGGPAFADCRRCAAGRWFGTVMPDGTVVPCHLVSAATAHPSGRRGGFARAFREMPHPTTGPGCAISPYQEMDLALHLDPAAIFAAARVARAPLVPRKGGAA